MSPIKREADTSERSSTPTPSSDRSDPTTASKKTKTTPKKPKAASSDSTRTPGGTFTPTQRGEFLDDIIAAGYKAVDLQKLAEKYGVKKSQIVDHLKPNRSNIRSKAVKAVQGE